MTTNNHYSGLTDNLVLIRRKEFGTNVLTPPAEESTWQKVKNCMHFWLLKFDLLVFVIVACAAIVLPIIGIYTHEGLWIAPVIAFVLYFLTYLVAYLGGNWNQKDCIFEIDDLFTILLFALILAGSIAFYNAAYCGVKGWSPFIELIGIAVAVLLATTVSHLLETSNEKTFKLLNDVNDDTLVKVIRNNNITQVPRREIVVGDIILLEAGEEVPADANLLECMNLVLNESSLTGEPQCHKTTNPDEFDLDATYPSNQIMKGCTVIEGDCIAQVFAVGDATACGKVFEAAQVRNGVDTPLSNNLNELAGLITKVSYSVAILVVLVRLVRHVTIYPSINLLLFLKYLSVGLLLAGVFSLYLVTKRNQYNVRRIELFQVLSFMLIPVFLIFQFMYDTALTSDWALFMKYALDTVMIAITLIVVAVPEGLPMAVTLSLAFSMKRLMKQNTLPRTMHACETMGAVSVICSDKTGTLTQNQMRVVGNMFPALNNQNAVDECISAQLAECVSINTTANLDFSDNEQIKAIGNPTEGALLLWLYSNGINYKEIRNSMSVIDRLQFSTQLKYMATIVNSVETGKRVIYVKGAPDILLNMCCISYNEYKKYEDKLAEFQSHAYRTLAFAYKELRDEEIAFEAGRLILCDLNMMGIVGIEDPVRSDVPLAINRCLKAGIDVKIVTGDAPGTAIEVARQLGIWTDSDTDENILQGKDIEENSSFCLMKRLKDVKIISRARPNDKEMVVKLLKQQGHVVAVTGDGTNDAPAMNAANVGLSMGDGTSVAKEASDMTIIDNSFSTIANAVMWGRSIYKNIKRFIYFQLTVNVAACFIVAIGAFIGEKAPLTVTQMLWVNLIMDTFAALALASLPPSEDVMCEKPRSVHEHILKDMTGYIFGVGGVLTVILIMLFAIFQHTDITSLTQLFDGSFSFSKHEGVSQYELTLFFTIFVMFQFWNLFNAKAFMTRDSAFKGLSWKKTKWFILITIIIMSGQVLMTETPGLQIMFNLVSGGISIIDWIIIIFMTSFVLWTGELIRFFKRLSGSPNKQ